MMELMNDQEKMAAAMAIKQLEAEAAMTTMIPIEEACDVCHQGEDQQDMTPRTSLGRSLKISCLTLMPTRMVL